MRCTSPIFRVKSERGEHIPPFLKRKIYTFEQFNHFVKYRGVDESCFVRLNCGQCLSCRINKAREWAERCYLEATLFESNYFITLTYSDEYLHFSECGLPTLNKRDIQLFMKRLRKWCNKVGKPSPRYFCTGEYGETTFRPHYHIILFNVKFDDLVYYKTVKRGTDIYTYQNSNVLTDLWGKGYAVVCSVTPETCAYTARYSLKKVGMNYSESYAKDILNDICSTDEKRFNAFCSLGYIQKPFNIQSNRPGIGGAFCEANLSNLLATDNIPGSKLKCIRYFDKIMERSNPQRLNELKDLRVLSVTKYENYNDKDYYKRESFVNAKYSRFKRKDI